MLHIGNYYLGIAYYRHFGTQLYLFLFGYPVMLSFGAMPRTWGKVWGK